MKERSVALVTTPSTSNRTPEECLGLEYLAAENRKDGHRVTYIDGWLSRLHNDQLCDEILKSKPEVVGLSPTMDSIEMVKGLARSLRERGFGGQIVLGGVYASFEANSILLAGNDGIDGVITGEADEAFGQFLVEKDLRGIPGAVFNQEGEVVLVPRQKVSDNLDTLPLPIRESMSLVRQNKTPSHIMGSRGCYGNCSFCSVACFQQFSSDKRWRGRNPQSIVTEVKHVANSGETMIKFVDDNFFGGANKTRELEIAKLIQEANIDIRFRVSLRVNDVSEEVISELKKAGLFAVSLGVESFVPRKLKDYKKGTSLEKNLRALEILNQHGVLVQMGHIMFDPYTTIEEIEEELHYLDLTSWAVTKGICTQLFAAEGTAITERIKNEVGCYTKQGTNYLYEIRDPKAKTFYEMLKPWARFVSPLYDRVIDPVSAPKNIPEEGHRQFASLCQQLKKVDIAVAQAALIQIKEGRSIEVADTAKKFYGAELRRIEREVDELYTRYGLNFDASTNRHIY